MIDEYLDHIRVLSNPFHQVDFDNDSIPRAAGVYAIVNQSNGNVYIGSAQQLLRRKRHHLVGLENNKHHSVYLQNAWNKYGKEKFKFVVIELVKEEQLVEREQWYLDHWPCEYNICKVAYSPLGIKRCPETLAKMKQSAQRGDSHWTRRTSISPESRKKMSIAQKNRCANRIMPWTGKKLPREMVDQMILRRLKPVLQFDLNNILIRDWPSATHAGDSLSIPNTNITRVCKGKALTAGGYRWTYKQTQTNLDI